MPSYYELYRRGMLGMMLIDALDELILTGRITPQLATQVLQQFDRSMSEALSKHVKAKTTLTGDLRVYRYCDDVWEFIVRNPIFDNGTITANRLKIVACNAKLAGEHT